MIDHKEYNLIYTHRETGVKYRARRITNHHFKLYQHETDPDGKNRFDVGVTRLRKEYIGCPMNKILGKENFRKCKNIYDYVS
jgi:hypothetical protein